MTARKVLVRVGGKNRQLPAGDTLIVPGMLALGDSVPWGLSEATIPGGRAADNGQLLNRADYPEFWTLISPQCVTDTYWIANPLERFKFSSGNGTTTFRMRDTNAKHPDGLTPAAAVLRGYGKNSAGAPGLFQLDQLGPMKYQSSSVNSLTNVYISNSVAGTLATLPRNGPGTTAVTPVDAAPDGSKWITNTGTETRATSATVIWCTVVASVATNQGSVDVTALATSVATQASRIQALESSLDFTLIYPNGGSSATPANVAIGTRYSEPNPYPGFFVMCVAQVLYLGEWADIGLGGYGSGTSAGVTASQRAGGNIIVETGTNFIGTTTPYAPWAASTRGNISTPLPCRVKVWKLKGASS